MAAQDRLLLQSGVAESRFVRWRFGRHTERFAGPGTEIMVLAAFRAKRAKQVAGAVNAVTSAAGATDNLGFWYFAHR